MSAKLRANENYMDDAFSSIMSNLIQGIKRKEERSIWGPADISRIKGKSSFTEYESYHTKLQNPQNIKNMDIIESKMTHNSRLITKVNFDDQENCADIKEQFVKNKNSDNQELVAASGSSKIMTKDMYENVNPENSNKKQVYNLNAITDGKGDIEKWLENRRREYLSRSSLSQSDAPTPLAMSMTNEIKKDTSSRVPITSKKKYEQIPINTKSDTVPEELENTKIHGPMYPKVSKIADIVVNDDCISENESQSSVEMSYDKKKMDLKEQHHSSNTIPKINAVEKVLSINTIGNTTIDKNLELKESIKSHTEVDDRNDFNNRYQKKNCSFKYKQSHSYELSPRPRVMNNKVDKRSDPKKQFLSENVHSKNKSFNEDLKDKVYRKMKENSTIHDSSECVFSNRKDLRFSVKENTQLCIKITDENREKFFDFMADSKAILRLRKTLPKLSADIPNVDSGFKEINYSADVMDIILRFVFCGSFKFIEPSAIVGVEVLAATKSWNINRLFEIFLEKFLQNILTPNNASLVLSHANHYNLKEVCEACKDISLNNPVLNTTARKKRQKRCLVSISTYVEPLEISIPFEPTETDLSLSFVKLIQNKFTFRVISGYYSITGFQVQLNEENVVKKGENDNMLIIDYTIKNGSDNHEISERQKKPLRTINSIYFKEELVIKPKEVGEIFIETDIEPYLCSAHKEKKVSVKDSVGELDLMMESNRKVQNSDRKIFLVGKFFYHVNLNSMVARKE